jgi:hypothetical protein
MSRDSSVGIAIGYGLEGQGSRPGSIQTGSGAHPAPYPWVSGALSLGVKRPVREADHSPSSSAVVKNGGAIPPLSPTS